MEDSPSKPSVAELAGRFKGHILPMPTSNDELHFRRRPPSSLKLQNQKDENEESDKTIVSPNPFKIKMKNSPIIEKLQFTRWAAMGQKGCRFSLFLFSPVQANLALSPTALLPSPKSPEVKLQPAPLSPTPPCSPLSPLSPTLRPSHLSSEEEDTVSFESPPEGTPLPSINKTRARLSFKRRPPTRQHRRSAREEAGAFGTALSPCELYSPKENGDMDQVFDSPAEEAEYGQPASLKEAEEKDRDCEQTEDEVARSDPDDRQHLEEKEEEEAEQAQSSKIFEEEQQLSEPCPVQQIEGDVSTDIGQEEMPQEKQQGGNDMV
ncbi:capZ-interacting protein isoform X2 [Micropterus dolomieu]|uniref:capZ-interacting protein isoform X2 n=1 Tax=Micropterus dolomieu TaxID=147949 RepID=UPI001E8CB846|nr:capZ-interacting protein isoform X2 [Micropterus dolomieu]